MMVGNGKVCIAVLPILCVAMNTQTPNMTQHPIRVRFAPSPTGYLHVGGLRTALYNYLFAKHHGGVTILRIEDTDRSRLVDDAVDKLIETLDWAGLRFDEGPVTGGPYGPYVQSERTELYQRHAEELLALGKAYRCFCTSEDLEASRMKQLANGLDPSYDRRCRSLEQAESDNRCAAGIPFTIRLKTPLVGSLQFTDLVRGDVTVQYDVIDDQVLLKSDGYPTYHLANVVDDHHMAVTHVIRGEEWLPSTPKHLLLYDCFGWAPPSFAHLPLLLNADRSKLSKRHGDVSVEAYKEKGYLPEALLNFLALLGWNPGDDREMFTLEELVREFSIERVSKAGAVFDAEKLRWFNSQYMRALPSEQLLALCLPRLQAAGIQTSNSTRCEAIVSLLSPYLSIPGDIDPLLTPFTEQAITLDSADARAALEEDSAAIVFSEFSRRAREITPWDAPTIKAMISGIQKECGIKGKQLFMPLRYALTGQAHGPDLGAIAELLGRDSCIRRIEAAAGQHRTP
jgi:nondiscriminating glutamyl-tRNA synthetase